MDSVITQEAIATPTSAACNTLHDHELLVIRCVPDSPSVMCGTVEIPVGSSLYSSMFVELFAICFHHESHGRFSHVFGTG